MRIAYVLYPDFTALDLVGPYEVISRWPDAEVHFVARSLEPVRSDRGLPVIPTAPPFDAGSTSKADASTLRLAFRMLLGDRIKIRLLNEMAGDHPMHHPFHVHGAGRFLILSRDGMTEPNLVWTA